MQIPRGGAASGPRLDVSMRAANPSKQPVRQAEVAQVTEEKAAQPSPRAKTPPCATRLTG